MAGKGARRAPRNRDAEMDGVLACASPTAVSGRRVSKMLKNLGFLVAALFGGFFAGVGQGTQAPEWFYWFVDQPPVVLPIGHAMELLVGDFNKDENPDLIISAHRGPYIWEFGPNFGSAEINIVMVLGDGRGGFGPPTVHLSTKGILIAKLVTDIDGDGRLDLILVRKYRSADFTYRSEIQAMFGDGKGKLSSPITLIEFEDLAHDVAVADLNDDGHLDFLIVHYTIGAVSVFLANGKGGFGRYAIIQVTTDPDHLLERLVLNDFNNDGRLDLAAGGFIYDKDEDRWTRFVVALLGDGAGWFPHRSFFRTFEPPESEFPWINLVALDYDRDGNMDLVTSRREKILLLRGNGDGTFTFDEDFWLPALDPVPLISAITDFNQDGCWDWVITLNSSPWWGLDLLISNCGVFIGRGFGYAGGNYVPSAAVVDLDKDDDLDLVFVTRHGAMGEELTALWIVLNNIGSGRQR